MLFGRINQVIMVFAIVVVTKVHPLCWGKHVKIQLFENEIFENPILNYNFEKKKSFFCAKGNQIEKGQTERMQNLP